MKYFYKIKVWSVYTREKNNQYFSHELPRKQKHETRFCRGGEGQCNLNTDFGQMKQKIGRKRMRQITKIGGGKGWGWGE